MSAPQHDMMREVGVATAKVTPAAAGTAITALTLNEWVAIVTIIYVVIQTLHLLWKWRREARK